MRTKKTMKFGAPAAALAKSLGIEEAKVTTTLEELRVESRTVRTAELETKLDAAVGDGTHTQAEVDAGTKAIEKGAIGDPGFGSAAL